jgi:hypothetical protein
VLVATREGLKLPDCPQNFFRHFLAHIDFIADFHRKLSLLDALLNGFVNGLLRLFGNGLTRRAREQVRRLSMGTSLLCSIFSISLMNSGATRSISSPAFSSTCATNSSSVLALMASGLNEGIFRSPTRWVGRCLDRLA